MKGLILLDVKYCDAIKHKGLEPVFFLGGGGGEGGQEMLSNIMYCLRSSSHI